MSMRHTSRSLTWSIRMGSRWAPTRPRLCSSPRSVATPAPSYSRSIVSQHHVASKALCPRRTVRSVVQLGGTSRMAYDLWRDHTPPTSVKGQSPAWRPSALS